MPRKNRTKHHEDFKLKDPMLSPTLTSMSSITEKDNANEDKSTQRSDVEDRLP